MSLPSGVNIPTECITAYTQLHNKRGAHKPFFLIYKISDDKRSIEVEESSTERNYEAFLQKLASSVDREGNPAPRYAVYDVEYDLKGDGKRATTVFISWVPEETSTRSRMLYAATKEQLRRMLDVKVSIHADELSDIEWMRVLREASGGRLQVWADQRVRKPAGPADRIPLSSQRLYAQPCRQDMLASGMSSAHVEETIKERRSRLSSLPPACEACKIRKVRCDRTTPCANCYASSITCRRPHDKVKGRAQADKVANLESLTERLERRLRTVESRLAALEGTRSGPATRDEASLDIPPPTQQLIDENHVFEGDSSFANQSLQASQSAQLAAFSTPVEHDSAVDQSLRQLQTALRVKPVLPKENFFFRRSSSQFVFAEQPLPAALVTCVLKRMRDKRPIFMSSYAVSDIALVDSLCQKVYSISEVASPGSIASMHGVLFFVLKELIAMEDPLCQQFNLADYLESCERAFIVAMETYEVLVVPSFENILALTMGMVKSQGETKPYLYWNLVCAAVTHCQSLGYHRESNYRGMSLEKAENTRRLFWTVYSFDKNMSLVLGRPSNMRGLAIDAHYPNISADPALRAWDESFIMGIKLAELQGRIFDGLHSTETMVRDSSQRTKLIGDLGVAMEKWMLDLKQINSEGVNNPQVFDLSRGNWDIMFYSTETLLFHASSSVGSNLHISSRCFRAACKSLNSHLQCFPKYQNSRLLSNGDYFNWILLSSSFIPFIVVFVHAIATKATENVTLLEQVVSTLENFREVSVGSGRLYQICATFTEVARKLVQSQLSPTGIYDRDKDALIFPDSTSLFHPEAFQNAFEPGDMNYLDPSYATDILNDWLSGPPFPWEKFEVGIDGCDDSGQMVL